MIINISLSFYFQKRLFKTNPIMAKSVNTSQKKFPALEDFPELSKHGNWMADVLKKDPAIYAKYRDVQTPNDFTFDKCIQTGVDNPGKKAHIHFSVYLHYSK